MADAALTTGEIITWGEGSVAQAKELEARLLAEEIPVRLTKPAAKACCGGGCGCGAKLAIEVRRDDVEKIVTVLQGDWLDAVRKEGLLTEGSKAVAFGLVQLGVPEGTDAALACPACGFQGVLVDGACGDCGLQLE